jgi:hypothetical protein
MAFPRTASLLLALTLIGAAVGCTPVSLTPIPTTPTSSTPDNPPATLSIRGKIRSEMLDQLALLVPPGEPAGRAVVYLSSGGGEFHTALKIARWLESVPESTAVVTRVCDSACVVIFAAARTRLVDRDAVFGVHRPQCSTDGLLGLPCRVFWEPWARGEFHDRVARVSPRWAAYLDAQEPPAFARAGADFVRVTGAQLIGFGAAAPLTIATMRAALTGE